MRGALSQHLEEAPRFWGIDANKARRAHVLIAEAAFSAAPLPRGRIRCPAAPPTSLAHVPHSIVFRDGTIRLLWIAYSVPPHPPLVGRGQSDGYLVSCSLRTASTHLHGLRRRPAPRQSCRRGRSDGLLGVSCSGGRHRDDLTVRRSAGAGQAHPPSRDPLYPPALGRSSPCSSLPNGPRAYGGGVGRDARDLPMTGVRSSPAIVLSRSYGPTASGLTAPRPLPRRLLNPTLEPPSPRLCSVPQATRGAAFHVVRPHRLPLLERAGARSHASHTRTSFPSRPTDGIADRRASEPAARRRSGLRAEAVSTLPDQQVGLRA